MKTKVFITAVALVAAMGLATAQNQNQVKKNRTTSAQTGLAFVDKNNNGVCDNFENGTPRNRNANGNQRLLNGSGRGQGRGTGLSNGQGRGRFFTDADKNGICDNYEKGMPRRGRSFVDIDKKDK